MPSEPAGDEPPATARGRIQDAIPIHWSIAAVALAALLVSAAQVSGVYSFPFASLLCGITTSLVSSGALYDFMHNYGYLSLFALMTVESASVPVPSELILPIAGYLVSQGVLGSLPVAVLVATAGALAGAFVDYYLALYLGRPFVVKIIRAFRMRSDDLDRAERWFQRSGQWTVFAARFVPLVRSLISFPAGLFRMGVRPFVAMTVLGCLVWNAVLLYAGYAAGAFITGVCSGSSAQLLVSSFSWVVLAVSVGYLIAYSAWRNRRPIAPASAS